MGICLKQPAVAYRGWKSASAQEAWIVHSDYLAEGLSRNQPQILAGICNFFPKGGQISNTFLCQSILWKKVEFWEGALEFGLFFIVVCFGSFKFQKAELQSGSKARSLLDSLDVPSVKKVPSLWGITGMVYVRYNHSEVEISTWMSGA